MSVNWRQSKICVVVYDKSQGSIAKHSSWDWLLHYKFIVQFADERSIRIDKHSAKLQAKWLTVIRPIRLALLPSKMQNSPDR